jgi:predicted alpha/beta-hydrolase family hydrolase
VLAGAKIMEARWVTLPRVEIMTAAGPAKAEVDRTENPPFLLVMTHSAGGGVGSGDLLAARQAGLALGATVARVAQPYQVRGARAPGSPARQDAAWLEIIAALRGSLPGVPLIQGGRSNGARVACRTARAAGALGVVALAFPLHPPGHPGRSRLAELQAAGTEVLVVNGASDPFGVPAGSGRIQVTVLPGETHALSRRPEEVERAVKAWLQRLAVGLA